MCSPILVEPNKSGKLRFILDLWSVNLEVSPPKFTLEDLGTVAALVRPGDWATVLDLKDGYWHLPVHPEDQRALAFRWGDRTYAFRSLPFGLSSAPAAFTKLMRPVVEELRRRLHPLGARCAIYLDDLGIWAPTRRASQRATRIALRLLSSLGFLVNFEKSQVESTQEVEYLGLVVDTTDPRTPPMIRVPADKCARVRRSVAHLLSCHRRGVPVTARELARVAGFLLSLSRAVLPTKVRVRSLYDVLGTGRNWRRRVALTVQAVEDLSWWQTSLHDWNGRLALPPREADVVVETDASDTGWGIAVPALGLRASGWWTAEEAARHINWKELQAVYLGLLSLRAPLLAASRSRPSPLAHMELRSDNTTTVWYVQKGGGRRTTLSAVARSVHLLCMEELGVSLTARHLPGVDNTEADALSRLTPGPSEWRLHPTAFRRLARRWGTPDVDAFATRANAQLPRFWAWRPNPAAEALDAFAQPWAGAHLWANPPWRSRLLLRLLRKVATEGATVTLVAPVWRAQAWWGLLRRLAVASAPLPSWSLRDPALRARGTTPEPLRNPRWRVRAWLLTPPFPPPGSSP